MRLAFLFVSLLAACDNSSTSSSSSALCMQYCTTIMTNCTGSDAVDGGTMKPHQQYSTMTNCLNSCKAMPVGNTGDKAGNTLNCRVYHAMAAAMDPDTHCPHAGPGGDGVCGATCDGYCQIAMMYCVGDAGVYASAADCQTTCAKFRDDAGYNVTDTSLQATGQVACLLYHAQEASLVPIDHCLGDLAPDPANHNSSTTCNDGPDAGP